MEELLRSLDIRGITETKLGEKSICTVNIKGYNFFHPDSPTNAGGAALYVANNLKAVPRPDIKCDIIIIIIIIMMMMMIILIDDINIAIFISA